MNGINSSNNPWDVVVIGGGPAGMMAAGRAGEQGKRVLLLEKNKKLGKKLLITGGGRCNITNNKQDNRTLLAKYRGSDKFLFSPFSQFAVQDTIAFFTSRGMEVKEENDGRMFPVSNRAQSVWDVMHRYLSKKNVVVQTNSRVKEITQQKEGFIVKTTNEIIHTKSVVVATGGKSHPETGSTGEGFEWLRNLGHTVVENDMALVPIKLRDTWTQKASGTTLENIKIHLYQDGVRQESVRGKVLFTHVGLSGPTILNMSKRIGEALQGGEVILALDLFPDLNEKEMKQHLQTVMVKESNKKIKNIFSLLVPSSLAGDILLLAEVDGETFTHSIRSEERAALAKLLKAIPLHVESLLGKDKAIISSGGVPLEEVDTRTMESKKVKGLFLVGDVLDVDRPSGGYSLQLCWTTGFVAGNNT